MNSRPDARDAAAAARHDFGHERSNSLAMAPRHATASLCSRKKSVNKPDTQAIRPD
jgi:hypothetical protein